MTDIVERLRAKHDDSWPQQIGLGDLYNQDGPEAADEIERLRAAVKAENEACAKIANELGHRHGASDGAYIADDIAAAIRARMEAKP